MKTITVINQGFMGDIVLSSPVVNRFRKCYPEAKIIFITGFKYFVSVGSARMHLELSLRVSTLALFIQENHIKWGSFIYRY